MFKRIASVIIVCLCLILMIAYNKTFKIEDTKLIDTVIKEDIPKETEEIIEKPVEYEEIVIETTLDSLYFIVDITAIDIGDTDNNYLIRGNTASEKLYSGEIWIKSNNIEDIELYQTYIFTVEPLMSFTTPPIVTEINHERASEIDIINLHNYRSKVSTYEECIDKYADMSLDEIISYSNKEYTTWTNNQIIKFKEFLIKQGYTDDYVNKSIVEIISIPGVIL